MSAALLLLTLLHVTGVRNWAPTDPAPVSRAGRVYVITGTVDGTRYTTQQLFMWGSQHFEVGRDYTIVKQDDRSLTVIVPDKKGRPVKERLDIVGAEQ